GFDARHDLVVQMEVMEEATYVRQHKKRIAFFFSAMRHFRLELEARGRRVHYVELDDPENRQPRKRDRAPAAPVRACAKHPARTGRLARAREDDQLARTARDASRSPLSLRQGLLLRLCTVPP